jgi:hypothetical protein
MQHEQEYCARALQAEEQRQQAASVRAKAIANEATTWNQQAEDTRRQAALAEAKRHKDTLATEERQPAALAAAKHEAAGRAAEALALVKESHRHEAVLAAETDDQRRHEPAARTVESEALTLIRRHEAETWALLSTKSPLADEQSCHEAAAGATASAKLALAVRPRVRPCRRTGRRNIPRAPSFFVKVAPTHPELLQAGLPTPTSTMLAQAISPCCSVVSSPMPVSTTPHTPSLHPFTFDDGTHLSSGGGSAHPFRERGLPLPPWKRMQRKHRPHCTCRRHQPCAPNQSTGWA